MLAAAAAATASPPSTRASPPLVVNLPFSYHQSRPTSSPPEEPWMAGAPPLAPPAKAFPLLIRYLFTDDLEGLEDDDDGEKSARG